MWNKKCNKKVIYRITCRQVLSKTLVYFSCLFLVFTRPGYISSTVHSGLALTFSVSFRNRTVRKVSLLQVFQVRSFSSINLSNWSLAVFLSILLGQTFSLFSDCQSETKSRHSCMNNCLFIFLYKVLRPTLTLSTSFCFPNLFVFCVYE